jgi:hypothetical protein
MIPGPVLVVGIDTGRIRQNPKECEQNNQNYELHTTYHLLKHAIEPTWPHQYRGI